MNKPDPTPQMAPTLYQINLRRRLTIASTAYMQVLGVACSTVFLSQGNLFGIILSSLLIQWMWTGNVKRMAVGNLTERLIYCFAATAGAVSGFYLSRGLIWLMK